MSHLGNKWVFLNYSEIQSLGNENVLGKLFKTLQKADIANSSFRENRVFDKKTLCEVWSSPTYINGCGIRHAKMFLKFWSLFERLHELLSSFH